MAAKPKKRFGWLLLITVFVWLLIGAMILTVDPESVANLGIRGGYVLFGILLAMGLFLLLTIIFLSAKRASWWTTGLMVFVYLRLFGLGNWLNALLILGLVLCVEFYVRLDKKV